MSLIKLRRRLLQLQLHYWRHVYTLIRLWLCAFINKSNGSQFKSAHYGNVFASVFMPLILLFSASFPEDAVNSFLSSFLFFLILTSLSYAKKKRQLNLDLLQNCWDMMCAWNLFTHRKHFILCMDFRIHYTLLVLRVRVASEWSLCVCTEYNTVKNHSRTCDGWHSDNHSWNIAYGILWM